MDSPKNMMATGNFAWVGVTTKIRRLRYVGDSFEISAIESVTNISKLSPTLM